MPTTMRQRIAYYFYKFQQISDMSVTQYESRLKELNRYAPKGSRSEAELSQQFFRRLFPRFIETLASYDLWAMR